MKWRKARNAERSCCVRADGSFFATLERRPARSSLSRTAVHASGFLSHATPSCCRPSNPRSTLSRRQTFSRSFPPPSLSPALSSRSLCFSVPAILAQSIIVVHLAPSRRRRPPLLHLPSCSRRCRRHERARIRARGAAVVKATAPLRATSGIYSTSSVIPWRSVISSLGSFLLMMDNRAAFR